LYIIQEKELVAFLLMPFTTKKIQVPFFPSFLERVGLFLLILMHFAKQQEGCLTLKTHYPSLHIFILDT